ncbi:thioredoxin family protein [Aquabacterium sp. OR-4]|uniref:thioredoxin family protein n=1 Tax=Aquabacterium sp. OR-4 TaxID=2978127 RepID=UPI0021B431A4|nr:thioredoxin family protein [Aquabacterium sp. OR-4]MDT7834002.1 thioredoxin family protein [Aquabacterium sp. OR-4]
MNTEPQVLVACLCAAWCNTCTVYRQTLAQLAATWPQHRFAWIDIEDDSDALGDDALEIENFPTVMILRGGAARAPAQLLFFGTLLPHISTLQRTLEALRDGSLATGSPVPPGMAQAVWRLGPQRPLPPA